MEILNKILGLLPVSRRRFAELGFYLEQILDAIETSDRQHCNVERDILQAMTEQQQEEENKKEDNTNHVEFG